MSSTKLFNPAFIKDIDFDAPVLIFVLETTSVVGAMTRIIPAGQLGLGFGDDYASIQYIGEGQEAQQEGLLTANFTQAEWEAARDKAGSVEKLAEALASSLWSTYQADQARQD